MINLYRNTSQQWLINLLTNGKIKTEGKNFISLSLDPDSGGQDNYGPCHIKFNGDIIFNYDSTYEVDYEDPEFFEQFPLITKHITGFSNSKEYYDSIGYDGPEDANDALELTWEQQCEGYSSEQEVVTEEIVYENGLIITVEFSEKPESKLIDLLNKSKIKYTINQIQEKNMYNYSKKLMKMNESKDVKMDKIKIEKDIDVICKKLDKEYQYKRYDIEFKKDIVYVTYIAQEDFYGRLEFNKMLKKYAKENNLIIYSYYETRDHDNSDDLTLYKKV